MNCLLPVPRLSAQNTNFHFPQVVCYIEAGTMREPRLSYTAAAMILKAIHVGHVYGFSVMETTGLPSGTVYPALRGLERDGWIRSQWESQAIADAGQRPPRKYYKIARLDGPP